MGCASSCRKVKPVDYEYLSLPGLVISGTDSKGRMTLNQYTILADISSGSSGTVQLAQKTGTPEMVAIKSLVRKRFGSLIGTEVAVLTQAHHPNVVRFYEVLDDIHHPLVYIVLEYVNGMPLMKLSDGGVASTPTIPEDRAAMYTMQICCGLEYLHNMQIVHCDLKPENILLTADKQTAKLTDFGVSKIFANENDATRKTTGTPIFMAPEMCKGEVFSSKAADVWAFGITLYSILYGVTPFRSTNQIQLFYSIQFDPITYEGKEKFSKGCNALLDRMLERDVLKRITLPEIRDHPWITGLKEPIRHQVPDPPALHCTPHLRPCVIPAVQRLCGPDPSFASLTQRSTTIFTWASTPNVLIVEDMYLSRELVKKLLQQHVAQEINVECCTDGESAVKMCTEKRFVLVFMDVHLGSMDGCEATTLIRQHEENLQMPRSYIMGLTADPHENIRELCCSSGMDGVLQKPITPLKLLEVLQRCRLKCNPYHHGQGLQGLDRDHAYNKAYIKYLESLGEQVSPTPTNPVIGSKETSLNSSSSPPCSPQQPKLVLDGTLYFFESKPQPVHKQGNLIEKQNQLLKAMDEIIREDEAT